MGRDAVPVILQLDVPAVGHVRRVAVEDVPGLLALLWIRPAQKKRVLISCWRSKDHAKLHLPQLIASLGVPVGAVSPPAAIAGGAVPKASWWPQTASGWIERAAAVWVAGTVCVGAAGWLFGRPSIEISVRTETEALQGSDYIVPVSVVNLSSQPVTVDLSVRGKKVEPRLLTLAGYESKTAEIRARAAGTNETLVLEGVASSGRLYPPRTTSASTLVHVWPSLGYSKTPTLVSHGDARAVLSVAIRAGRAMPHGLDCVAYALSEPGTAFIGASNVSGFTPLTGREPRNEITQVDWRLPPLQPFDRVTPKLHVTGQRTPEQWAVFAAKTRVECQEVSNETPKR